MMVVKQHIDVWKILYMIKNQVHYIFNVKMVDGDHDQDVFVCAYIFFSHHCFIFDFVYLASGCLEPLPDTIENGWKSGESYTIEGDTKYYQLTRYSCNTNAIMIDSSSRVIDIECRNGQWEYESLPQCHLQEEK